MSQAMNESFASLLDAAFPPRSSHEGKVLRGRIVAIHNDMAVIDVGLKSEGRVSMKELVGKTGSLDDIRVNDDIDVFVERLEDKNGEAVLSVEKARREAVWTQLEDACANATLVNGVIFSRVKGGFAVDVNGTMAFLPGSQVDIRPIRDVSPLVGIEQPFIILKMDRARNNIVVSRRAVMEASRAEARGELISNLQEGQIVSGVVKNITDYGAFVDLGGIDGLLHVTDIAWKRVNHPLDVLKLGDVVDVIVIRFNRDTQRISLGMKQLADDPWKGVESNFIVGEKYPGRVTNVADYGAFVQVAEGIEGLIYVTEMSWFKKNQHPNKVLAPGQEIEVMVLDVDSTKRRMSLGLKQCLANPWKEFQEKHPAGTVVQGVVRNITEFGMFVGLTDDIDGMVHMSDVSWNTTDEPLQEQFKKGETISVKILEIDPNKERVSLGIKQLGEDPFEGLVSTVEVGANVEGTVVHVSDRGVDVLLASGVPAFIRKNDLSRDRDAQRSDRFSVGETVEGKVVNIDRQMRKVIVSIKAQEMDVEKTVLSEYAAETGSASLGDLLEKAMEEKRRAVDL